MEKKKWNKHCVRLFVSLDLLQIFCHSCYGASVAHFSALNYFNEGEVLSLSTCQPNKREEFRWYLVKSLEIVDSCAIEWNPKRQHFWPYFNCCNVQNKVCKWFITPDIQCTLSSGCYFPVASFVHLFHNSNSKFDKHNDWREADWVSGATNSFDCSFECHSLEELAIAKSIPSTNFQKLIVIIDRLILLYSKPLFHSTQFLCGMSMPWK